MQQHPTPADFGRVRETTDDLDAPDLPARRPRTSKSQAESSAPHVGTKNGNGAQDLSPQRWPAKGKRSPIRNPVLSADKSVALREQLLGEVQTLKSPEAAVTWASQTLGAKNSLTAADARLVEDSFRSRMASVDSQNVDEGATRSPAKPEQPNSPPPVEEVIRIAPRAD